MQSRRLLAAGMRRGAQRGYVSTAATTTTVAASASAANVPHTVITPPTSPYIAEAHASPTAHSAEHVGQYYPLPGEQLFPEGFAGT